MTGARRPRHCDVVGLDQPVPAVAASVPPVARSGRVVLALWRRAKRGRSPRSAPAPGCRPCSPHPDRDYAAARVQVASTEGDRPRHHRRARQGSRASRPRCRCAGPAARGARCSRARDGSFAGSPGRSSRAGQGHARPCAALAVATSAPRACTSASATSTSSPARVTPAAAARRSCSPATIPLLRAAVFGNDDRWRRLTDPVDSPAGQVDRVSRDPDAAGSVWPLVAQELMKRRTRCPSRSSPGARRRRQHRRAGDVPRRRRIVRRTLYALDGAPHPRRRRPRPRRALLAGRSRRQGVARPGSVYVGLAAAARARIVRRDFGAPLRRGADRRLRVGASRTRPSTPMRLAQAIARGDGANVVGRPGALRHRPRKRSCTSADPDDVELAARRWAAAILARRARPRRRPVTPGLERAELGRRPHDRRSLPRPGAVAAHAGLVGGFVVRSAGDDVPARERHRRGRRRRAAASLAAPAAGPARRSPLGEGRSGAGAPCPATPPRWRLPMLPFVARAGRRTPCSAVARPEAPR